MDFLRWMNRWTWIGTVVVLLGTVALFIAVVMTETWWTLVPQTIILVALAGIWRVLYRLYRQELDT